MTFMITALTSCGDAPKGAAPWIVDRFDDIKVMSCDIPKKLTGIK